MKKLFFLILLSIFTFSIEAQIEDLAGKLDVHVGYSDPLNRNYPIAGMFSLNAEPKFWHNDELTIGLKLGLNFLLDEDLKRKPIKSIMILGEKHKELGEFIFFYGASSGILFGGEPKSFNTKSAKSFAIVPRIGLQLGQYRLMAEYNIRKTNAKFFSLMLGYTLTGE